MEDIVLTVEEMQEQERIREKKETKRQKKQQKKYLKKEKKREIKEMRTVIQTIKRIFDRMEKVDDMNLRCYMMMDKFLLLLDAGTAVMNMESLPKKERLNFNKQLNTISEQVTCIMKWLVDERKVVGPAVANPIDDTAVNDY